MENFKGIEGPIEIPIKPVTLLFGANSAGKSSILHALHFIRGALEDYELDPSGSPFAGDAIDLGGFANLVHKHKSGRRVVLAFALDLSSDDLPEYGADDQPSISESLTSAEVEFGFSLGNHPRSPQVDYYLVKLNGSDAVLVLPDDVHRADGRRRTAYVSLQHPLLASAVNAIEEERPALVLRHMIPLPASQQTPDVLDADEQDKIDAERREQRVAAASHTDLYAVSLQGFREGLPPWGKVVSVIGDNRGEDEPLLDKRVLSELVTGPLEVLKDLLHTGRAIGPLRMIPPRRLIPSSRTNEADWYSGLAAWQRLNQIWDVQLINGVNAWLGDVDKLGTNYSIQSFEYKEVDHDLADSLVEEQHPRLTPELIDEITKTPVRVRIYLRDALNNVNVTPHDVGVGLSQLIPVVVAAVDRSSSLVMVEQPELHVHPRIQVGLGDLFVAQAKERGCNFIVETHSEALLLRIMKRMRQTAGDELPQGMPRATADDIAIHLIQNAGKGVVVTTIELTEDGEFVRPWPGGFFEETLKEAF